MQKFQEGYYESQCLQEADASSPWQAPTGGHVCVRTAASEG